MWLCVVLHVSDRWKSAGGSLGADTRAECSGKRCATGLKWFVCREATIVVVSGEDCICGPIRR